MATDPAYLLKVIAQVFFIIVLPPIAVLIQTLWEGYFDWLHLLVNFLLCLLLWIPGVIHAIWYCFIR
jgi:uncharacterized membrane protein YqaE (UPF0057 family)